MEEWFKEPNYVKEALETIKKLESMNGADSSAEFQMTRALVMALLAIARK